MHCGRNIGKIRELLGIKQETLAVMLKISQQTVSKIEQTEHLNEHTIERMAKALNVPSMAITNYNEHAFLEHLKETVSPIDAPDPASYCAELVNK